MSHTREMLDVVPRTWRLDRDELAAAIDACADCTQTCTACADASSLEDDVADLQVVIAIDGDCADLCAATARILSRQSYDDVLLIQRVLQACVRACLTCAEECGRHADHHEHCRVCAETCRICAQACTRLLEAEAISELQSLAGG
jgi:hypothetical protein